jgi:hypothetical protein
MTKIIFLHIPKTAGQSVHHFFQTSFTKDEICPARVNGQLKELDCDTLNKYTVFSGHLDWQYLECLEGSKYVFTILREPKERILSFYFYLRSQAAKLSETDLNAPSNQGMKAALTLTPDEYFCEAKGSIRTFLDNHYDNFYMYYFAGKTYDSREKLLSMGKDEVYELAMTNLHTLDKVYTISNWEDLYEDIQRIYPSIKVPEKTIHVNKGDSLDFGSRYYELIKLGATEKTFEKINEFCQYDEKIFNSFKY